MLKKGEIAPDFELHSTPDKKWKLSDFKGKNIIMAFYPADWSPVCTDQMALYNEMLDYFNNYNAVLVGISVDSKWCHKAFSESRNLGFPLLADFEEKGNVSKLYGSYDGFHGESKRTLYVIDKDGKVHWSYESPIGTNPGADGIINALEELNS